MEGDFLKMNLRELFPGGLKIIGNFPYNISSQIFFKVLENRDLVPECVGMIQKEVAVRLAEPPGSKEYGILSVLLQAWYDIEYLFTVNETVFNPPPKVKSAVVRLRRNGVDRLDCDERLFVRVVKASGSASAARCCATPCGRLSAISEGWNIPSSRSVPSSFRLPISSN